MFLEISQNSQENTCVRASFLIKFPQACNFIKKEDLTQMLYCEFCEISKNTFFHKSPLVTASESNRYSFFYRKSFTKLSVLSEAVVQRCSVKKVFLNILQNLRENTCARVSFLINFIKEGTLAQVFLVNFMKFSRTPIFIERLWWLLLSCFSSLFLTKVTISINVLGIIRKSTLDCCLMARSFLLFHIC